VNPYLKQLVYEDASLIDHGNVERAPVLEEGQIEQLIVDGEVVIGCIFVWGC
jgi:hypothetical protein